MLIDGTSSEWTVRRDGNQPARLIIGNTAGSTGTVTVSGGGKLSLDNAVNPGGQGQDAGIGVGSSGKGTLIVTGAGSTVDNSNAGAFINIGGSAGSDGAFQVLAGASATSTFLNVGRNAGATGSMLIDGPNSVSLTLSGASTIPGQTGTAGASIGRNGGEGTAVVSNGGYWLITDGGQDGRSVGNPGLSVGRDNNSKGLLTITGAGSKVEVIGTSGVGARRTRQQQPLRQHWARNAGGANQGELMVSAGGKLVLTGNAVSTTTNGRTTSLNIGGRGGFAGKGTATVTGAGSEIIVQGYDAVINVGREAGGIGALNVLAGGKVSSTSLAVGISGQGTVNINGGTIALSGDRSDTEPAVGAASTFGRGVGGDGYVGHEERRQLHDHADRVEWWPRLWRRRISPRRHRQADDERWVIDRGERTSQRQRSHDRPHWHGYCRLEWRKLDHRHQRQSVRRPRGRFQRHADTEREFGGRRRLRWRRGQRTRCRQCAGGAGRHRHAGTERQHDQHQTLRARRGQHPDRQQRRHQRRGGRAGGHRRHRQPR